MQYLPNLLCWLNMENCSDSPRAYFSFKMNDNGAATWNYFGITPPTTMNVAIILLGENPQKQ